MFDMRGLHGCHLTESPGEVGSRAALVPVYFM